MELDDAFTARYPQRLIELGSRRSLLRRPRPFVDAADRRRAAHFSVPAQRSQVPAELAAASQQKLRYASPQKNAQMAKIGQSLCVVCPLAANASVFWFRTLSLWQTPAKRPAAYDGDSSAALRMKSGAADGPVVRPYPSNP